MNIKFCVCGKDRYGNDYRFETWDEAEAHQIASKVNKRGGTVVVFRLKYDGPKASYAKDLTYNSQRQW